MTIPYPQGSKLQLWVVDSGVLETCSIFLNGSLVDLISDGLKHPYDIQPPPKDASIAIAVHFGGRDGGHSAIVDITSTPRVIEKLGPADGLRHSFILVGV